jgi:hypothetical protein
VNGEVAVIPDSKALGSTNPEEENGIKPSEPDAAEAGRPELSVGNELVRSVSESKWSNGSLERGMEAVLPQALGSMDGVARESPTEAMSLRVPAFAHSGGTRFVKVYHRSTLSDLTKNASFWRPGAINGKNS